MIGVSKLYCGTVEPSDALRYGRKAKDLPSHLLQFSEDKKPVVVWNCTRSCNLRCIHCYSQSQCQAYEGELSTDEGKRLIDSLAEFGAPVILFSGGEPLMRKDLFELAAYAVASGLRAVISTNGTLITEQIAERLQTIRLSYVGVSLDGTEKVNDAFRGMEGAYQRALRGIRSCLAVGLKVGLRFTINRRNVSEIPAIFDIIREENIPRVCFYHLVYSGRGSALIDEALSPTETRRAVDFIIDKTAELHREGRPVEVLTVDNHCDGPYIYLRLTKENPERAREVLKLLQFNEGNSSGVGIACVSWDGSVHPDQFWRHLVLGNVRERKFGEIWTDRNNELLMKIKNKKRHVTGRCAACKWLEICGGNFRVRAEAMTGDLWAPDPACYLTDEEIGLT
ncbi:MAG TPA: 12,18-didecarboxysiroheme deacetylase [Candidatus Hydrogenedentes bacterium]|nr:12,18-didecarboxysiroheme deacetylase [Candidatus Hydrogenedentota bacterium]HOL77160.1 12,18-didecarboxysiroheme deacetylase [Candidatus Hydrogenedentota bacterium]HPO85901.1 12,18-didecarboxysiroheme deacetylase [Candidatus Hydrogenedentota bacterium]